MSLACGIYSRPSLPDRLVPGALRYHPDVIFFVTSVAGLAFGAGDQYLGSLKPMVALGPWTVSICQMSALWLLVPFAFGCTQDHPRRAMLLGLTATGAALAGYFVMTVSPMESVPISQFPTAAVAMVGSNVLWILGGALTGPLFGLLGQRWRAQRWWASAAVSGGALLLEPLARHLRGQVIGPWWIWAVESTVGAGLLAAFVFVATLRPRPAETT